MSGVDLTLELIDVLRLCDIALSQLRKRGRRAAETEQEYRIALAKKELFLRDDGKPATLIGDLARGDKEVAALKMVRDIAEIDYEANREAINVYKLKARLIEAQIAREWGKAD